MRSAVLSNTAAQLAALLSDSMYTQHSSRARIVVYEQGEFEAAAVSGC